MNGKQAWVVAVDMGYGHQRAAYPLRRLAYGGTLLNANHYSGIPRRDQKIWQEGQKTYEFMSRFKQVPIVGEMVWAAYDHFQKIEPFYPKRDLSKPTLQLTSTYSLIRKKRWGEHFIRRLAKNPLPLVTSFFITAYQAEEFNYPGDIHLVVCDADVSRAWAPLKPHRTRIKYYAPTDRSAERLKLYGVPEENITLSGFPLPAENIGKANKEIKRDLAARLFNLDPRHTYRKKYHRTIGEHVGAFPSRPNHPFTLMFAVGGAGAQRELGLTIAESFQHDLGEGSARLILVAGIHNDVNSYFKKGLNDLGLRSAVERGAIEVIFASNKQDYFKKFNAALHTTDVLWTKPSELVFYAGLGIPVICSEPIGSQEHFNRRWISEVGAGIRQHDPRYASEWMHDYLQEGTFAEMAMQGFLDIERGGTDAISTLIRYERTAIA